MFYFLNSMDMNLMIWLHQNFSNTLFDIFKPGPVQVMDDMDDSIGVMMDDVVAGILACLVTQSLLYFYQ